MERYKEYKSSKVYWINEIPISWQQIKISRIFHSIGSGTTPSSGDNTFYVDEGWNWLQSGDFKDNFVYDTSKKISEVAINKYGLKLYPENAIVIAMYGASIGKVGFLKIKTTVNQACCVLYDSPIMNMHYAFYSLISEKNNLIRKSKGGTQPNISQELIKGHYLAVPPLAEQEKIVSYLEDKTSKIDAYVADKEKEIELLQELKQKTIADAVTKGLNPDAKMKDSGISWIGEIPEHWEVKQLRSFLTLFTEKGHGDAQLLSVTREQGVIERDKYDKDENHNFVPDDLSGYKYIEKGDFAINKMKAWQGSYAVSNYDGIVSPAYFTCKLKGVNNDFFSKAIRSRAYVPFFTQYSKGIRVGQWDLNPNALKSIPFFLPPSDEQQAIVAYIEEKCEKIDKLASELQSEIDYLKDYKQRLIADCVTGQVNVQNEMI